MKLKITMEMFVEMSDQSAFDRFGTTDAYTTAQVMTREAIESAKEMRDDAQGDGMDVLAMTAVVVPLHG